MTAGLIVAAGLWLFVALLHVAGRIVQSPRFMAMMLRGHWAAAVRRLPDVDGGDRGGWLVAAGPLRCWWLLDRHGMPGDVSFAELRREVGRAR